MALGPRSTDPFDGEGGAPAPTVDPAVDGAGALRPAVAGRERNAGLIAVGGGALALGLIAFLVLSSRRAPPPDGNAMTAIPTGPATAASTAPLPTAPDFSALEAAGRGQGAQPAPTAPIPPPFTPAPLTPPATSAPAPLVLAGAPKPAVPSTAAADEAARQKAPTLIVDLAEGPTGAPAAVLGATGNTLGPGGAAGAPGAKPGAEGPRLSGDEQFAARVETAEAPDRVRASMLRNQSATIAQGATIAGVLETALNSDLPGFARAVVSQDVRGFDGSAVLIPRGSHVIGQYKSGVALGASRAFVIWTRVIRPDGGSIQIGSPGTDPLGRAGLEGDVNRHFFQRFGGAALLSVISAGTAAITRGNSTSVVIGNSSDASSVATQALLPTNISPTIKVPQGAPIRIFVARDLDFSPLQGGR